MDKLTFRTLRADEIECRVAQVKEKGVVLLLYKDARCDMNILDETVGALNWKRSHSRENANCTVSIWDEGKQQWISKEDTGTESYTEKEKGLASDSFKRACFNWGIGRELYTAPFIWVSAEKCNISQKGSGYTCYDSFSITQIGYDERKNIVKLVIRNDKRNCDVYTYSSKAQPARETPVREPDPRNQEQNDSKQLIDSAKLKELLNLIHEKKVPEEKVLERFKKARLEDMTVEEWMRAKSGLKNTGNGGNNGANR